MTAEITGKAKEISSNTLSLLKRWSINALRRVIILFRYVAVYLHHRRLNRGWRRLGKEVHLALERGEINPMLAEPVRDAVLQVRDLKAAKDRQLEAIAAIRAKIRESRGLPPLPEGKPQDLDTAARGE